MPEGLAVALVLVPRGVPKFQTFAMAILSSLPQPIIAVWCLSHPACHRSVFVCVFVLASCSPVSDFELQPVYPFLGPTVHLALIWVPFYILFDEMMAWVIIFIPCM